MITHDKKRVACIVLLKFSINLKRYNTRGMCAKSFNLNEINECSDLINKAQISR